jgi:hypothetical protein
MSAQFKIVKGSRADYPLQTWNRGSMSAPAYAPSDTFTATISRGQDQVSLFAPTITWYTANSTQTGYDQGDVVLSISASQSATLEAGGTYSGAIWWTQQTMCVGRFTLSVEPAAGTATQAIATYNSYQDMLLHAAWVKLCQRPDTDQEGFYSQRLEARYWMDGLILASYRYGSIIPFGDPMYSADQWSGGWGGGNTGATSQWLRTWLAQDRLLLRPDVVRACTFKAISIVGLSTIGGGNNYAAMGQVFASRADAEALMLTAEIDTATPPNGLVGLPIRLNVVNVVYG